MFFDIYIELNFRVRKKVANISSTNNNNNNNIDAKNISQTIYFWNKLHVHMDYMNTSNEIDYGILARVRSWQGHEKSHIPLSFDWKAFLSIIHHR